MNEEVKKLIEKLKEVMINMYRSASDLDQWIQQVELKLNDETIDSELMNLYIKTIVSYRRDIRKIKNFDGLGSKEDAFWEMLILETDPNRETEEQES